MDITLEKIDLIRERAGVSYREAKEALEKAEGNVIEALIALEDDRKNWKQEFSTWREEFTVKGNEVTDKIKDLVRQGNVNKITVKHEGKKVVEIPVALGALGSLILPELAVLGILGALFKQYTIELERSEPQEQPPTEDQRGVNDHRDITGVQ